MNRIEVFLPLPGMTEAMNAHFTDPLVLRPFGLPTGAELYADDLSEEELLSIGYDAAQEEVSNSTQWTDEEYIVDRDTAFIAEFCNDEGVQIGWEFEFLVSSV